MPCFFGKDWQRARRDSPIGLPRLNVPGSSELTWSGRGSPLFLDVESEVLGDSKTVGIANFDVKCNGFSYSGCS